MAEEKARPTRGRKKAESTGAADDSVTSPRTGKVTAEATEATKPKATRKPATKKAEATKTTAERAAAKTTVGRTTIPRAKRIVAIVPEPSAEAIAERAYLLWERGEPGDQTEHWLRAEAELHAA